MVQINLVGEHYSLYYTILSKVNLLYCLWLLQYPSPPLGVLKELHCKRKIYFLSFTNFALIRHSFKLTLCLT